MRRYYMLENGRLLRGTTYKNMVEIAIVPGHIKTLVVAYKWYRDGGAA